MKEKLYQHFSEDERVFVDRVLDWLEAVEQNYTVVSTYFLNPREHEILQALVSKRPLQLFSSLDFAETEMCKVVIAPDFYELDEADFDLALLEIAYAGKFHQLKHSQILGTLLGQTGLRRQEFGDILVAEGRAQVFVSAPLVQTIRENISKIGEASVKFKEIPWENKISATDNAQSKQILVSNLRIDKIISDSFNMSRNIAVNMIESKKVKVNFRTIEKKDFSVETGDLISLRGFGRVKIVALLGLTKKDKYKVEIEITRNKR